VAARAEAAADKTRDLVALEAADAFYKWEESFEKVAKLTAAVADAEKAAEQASRAVDSGVIPSYRDALEIQVMAAQLRAQLNEALYNHAVALTELERVTAGAFPTITTNIP
jgi:outer membrane protein TolC